MQNSEQVKARRQQLLQERDKTSFRRYFSSVGYAVLASLCAIPLTRNKVLMQCRPEMVIRGMEPHFKGPLSAFSHIRKNEGNTKFVRGIIPFLGFIIPYSFIRQSATASFSQDLDERPSAIAAYSRGFAAVTVASIVSSIFTPLTIAATKMMADTKPAKRAIYEYHGPMVTMRSVYAFGGLSKLFVGAIPFWLHNMIHFTALYGLTSLFSSPNLGLNPVIATLLSSALAVVVAHPIDTVRSRMQYRIHTQVTDYIPEYKGVLDCVRSIWKAEGMKGFYRGTTGNLGIFVIATMWMIFASSRGHTLKGKEAKNEVLVQKRLEYAKEHKNKFQQERRLEERFYSYERNKLTE